MTRENQRPSWRTIPHAMDKNLYIDEIAAYLFYPDLKERAFADMQVYRKDALAVARLPVPLEVKGQRVLRLQDVLHGKLVVLLTEQLARSPGNPARAIQGTLSDQLG